MIVYEVFIDPFEYEVWRSAAATEFTVHRYQLSAGGKGTRHQIGDPVYADRPAYEYSAQSYDEMVARALRQERGDIA